MSWLCRTPCHTRKIYCFIPHELPLVQAVQVGENLLGVAQVVGEDVMIVPHTLSTDAVQCLFKASGPVLI
jgi:hypothetical protein